MDVESQLSRRRAEVPLFERRGRNWPPNERLLSIKRSDHTTPLSSPSSELLCFTCRMIDFDKLKFWDDIAVSGINLDHVDAKSDCALCKFFLNMEERGGPPETRIHFPGDSSARLYGCSFHCNAPSQPECGPTSVVYYVQSGEKRYRYSNGPKSGLYFTVESGPALKHNGLLRITGTDRDVDWKKIRTWLEFCQENHHLCRQTTQISGLVFIDCETRRIVPNPARATPYITLSYVWGPANPSEATTGNEHNQFPKTIEDAITVVRLLGWRYLWVDRYCIPQNDVKEKSRLISLMGDIYKDSLLTIIAAAGASPERGLPGVSPSSRLARPPLKIAEWIIGVQEFSFLEDIQQSTWNSRGWTYQEAVLSTRKLIFSGDQLYFQCNTMNCFEGIDYPLPSIPLKPYDAKMWKWWNGDTELPRALPRGGVGDSPQDLLLEIADYSRRNLTYQDDVLRAFQGVIQAWGNTGFTDGFLCGLPIFSRTSYSSGDDEKTITDRLAHALCWNMGSLQGSTIQRRQGFPSWTWAGWKTSIKFFTYSGLTAQGKLNIPSLSSLAGFKLDFGEGVILDSVKDELMLLGRLQEVDTIPVIHISAKVVDLEWLDNLMEMECWPSVINVRSSKTPNFMGQINSHSLAVSPKQLAGVPCKALVMARELYSTPPKFLFVAKFSNCSYFERVGSGLLTDPREARASGLHRHSMRGWEDWASEELILG